MTNKMEKLAKPNNGEAKKLFLILSSLSRIGDRMWGFAAFLLLTYAFPDHRFILGKDTVKS